MLFKLVINNYYFQPTASCYSYYPSTCSVFSLASIGMSETLLPPLSKSDWVNPLKIKKNILGMWKKGKDSLSVNSSDYPISYQWYFLMFSRGIERGQWHEIMRSVAFLPNYMVIVENYGINELTLLKLALWIVIFAPPVNEYVPRILALWQYCTLLSCHPMQRSFDLDHFWSGEVVDWQSGDCVW